ncbi:hypothetical protein L2E82_02921 [Cichorium intybus]|uniref:Uncharacterized protein n=1 Tax=Cichorium intybus TaxID=13427 RepID=A0ACB9H553_CICIN|nr:hypothetical protein L2E82_02921 [Cichorium intybus]
MASLYKLFSFSFSPGDEDLPRYEHYRDAVVMQLKHGQIGKWRELGNMWEEGEKRQVGRISIVEDINGGSPGIFMLDKKDIFRFYDVGVCSYEFFPSQKSLQYPSKRHWKIRNCEDIVGFKQNKSCVSFDTKGETWPGNRIPFPCAISVCVFLQTSRAPLLD